MNPLIRPLAALCLVLSQVVAPAGNGALFAQSPVENASAMTTVNVTVDVLVNRHAISPYVYGGAYPKDAATITDSGLSVVRWGGNATSRYNWKTFTNSAAADWYFEDFPYTEIGDGDSIKYIQDVKAAGSHPIMTMPMLPWEREMPSSAARATRSQ